MSNKDYRPTLAQLRTFVTIAEHKHFGTAANKLQISQPSLSQALVALEQGLNIQLIERSTRRVIVTAAGEKLLPYAKATLDAADTFLNQSRGASGPLSGQLAIGIIPTVAPYILPEFLTLVNEAYPDLEPLIVEEQTHHLIQQLRDGRLDLAIIALPSEAPGLVERPLYKERFSVVVHSDHPLANRDNVKLKDLEDLDLLLLDDGHCLRDQIIDLCRAAQVNPSKSTNSVTRAASLTTIVQLVAAGLGSTLVPESAISLGCGHSNLAVSHFAKNVTAEREIGIVFRSSAARSEAFEKLGDLVTQAFNTAIAANNTHDVVAE